MRREAYGYITRSFSASHSAPHLHTSHPKTQPRPTTASPKRHRFWAQYQDPDTAVSGSLDCSFGRTLRGLSHHSRIPERNTNSESRLASSSPPLPRAVATVQTPSSRQHHFPYGTVGANLKKGSPH